MKKHKFNPFSLVRNLQPGQKWVLHLIPSQTYTVVMIERSHPQLPGHFDVRDLSSGVTRLMPCYGRPGQYEFVCPYTSENGIEVAKMIVAAKGRVRKKSNWDIISSLFRK